MSSLQNLMNLTKKERAETGKMQIVRKKLGIQMQKQQQKKRMDKRNQSNNSLLQSRKWFNEPIILICAEIKSYLVKLRRFVFALKLNKEKQLAIKRTLFAIIFQL